MPAPTSPQDQTAALGEPGEELLALAFGGGGFATAFQLGVVHSLLVADSRAPHVVVGLSAGAVHAATLAEVLQAGGDEQGSDEAGSDEQRRAARLTARVARLRELLEHFQLAAEELIPSLLPDPHEIEAREALEPLQLPVHFAAERRQRQQANRERQGLIDLLNRLLSVRLSVAAATRITQRALALVESGAEPRRFARWWRKGRHVSALLFLFLRHLVPLRRLVRPVL
ncbi:MAG TPA: patatin-like phospholipase family protein, partial [Thermoanaerobaculia bacterium]|nr:patatin-like phospholipase family protein [Thermoanaerobaculia bacterium]